MEYNPLNAPDPKEWFAMNEMERNLVVQEYHQKAGIEIQNATMHATIHVIIENQLLEGLPDAVEALERLQYQGLDRHDAIHAIGTVLLDHLSEIIHSPQESVEADPMESYLKDLRKLTKKSWLKKIRNKR